MRAGSVLLTMMFVIFAGCSKTQDPTPSWLVIDMAVSGGGDFDKTRPSGRRQMVVYVNDQTKPPLFQDLVIGKANAYRFGPIHENISELRVDPNPGVSDAEASIHSIRIETNDKIVTEYLPQQMLDFMVVGGERKLAADSVTFKATSSNLILVLKDINAPKGPPSIK